MAKAQTRKQYVEAWKTHNQEMFSVARSAGDDIQLALEMQDHLLKTNDYIEKIADKLVEDGVLRADIVFVDIK